MGGRSFSQTGYGSLFRPKPPLVGLAGALLHLPPSKTDGLARGICNTRERAPFGPARRLRINICLTRRSGSAAEGFHDDEVNRERCRSRGTCFRTRLYGAAGDAALSCRGERLRSSSPRELYRCHADFGDACPPGRRPVPPPVPHAVAQAALPAARAPPAHHRAVPPSADARNAAGDRAG